VDQTHSQWRNEGDNLLTGFKVEDRVFFRNVVRMTPTDFEVLLRIVAKYQASTFSRLFWALTLAVVHDRLLSCIEKRPHLQSLCLAFHFQREKRNAEYLFADCLQTRTKLVCKLFANTICRCVQAFSSIKYWDSGTLKWAMAVCFHVLTAASLRITILFDAM
jgi:hypothetical protein